MRLQTLQNLTDTSVTDLVLVQKLKTIKEDENDDIEVIKMVQKFVISNNGDNGDGDDEFLKQTPLHPRNKLKCPEKKYLQILAKRKELIQRSKKQSKEIELIKKVPPHPCERLKWKNRLKYKPELK